MANDSPGNANAFILPGGKVFVYSGILRITRSEDGLAAVLGHEIAHNLAQHHGERMSGTIGPNMLLYGLILMTAPVPGAFFALQALGGWLLDTLFGRPMSRKMESEADYIGLMLMAEACYDPWEAIHFWRRMERAVKAGDAVEIPEWMSTHPSVCSVVSSPLPLSLSQLTASSVCRTKTGLRRYPSGYRRPWRREA